MAADGGAGTAGTAGSEGSAAGAPAVLLLAAMATELRPVARALGLRRAQVGGVEVRTGDGPGGRPVVASVVG
ncbi:MAG: hypothetical protein ACRDZR_16935, partial [Acidimicrobiales bacterium]